MHLFCNFSDVKQWPLFTMPFFLIFWPGGMWIVQALLLIAWWIYFDKHQRAYATIFKSLWDITLYRYLLGAIAGYLLWSLVAIMFLNSSLKSIDNALILVLWCLMIPVIQQLKPNPVLLGYGCVLALVLALGVALVQFHYFKLSRAYGLYGSGKTGSGAIKFGDMSLMFGVLALIFLSEQKTRLLGILGLLLGLLICVYASSRGGLFALALCVPVWRFVIKDNRGFGYQSMGFIVAGILSLYALNALMDDYLLLRIFETETEVRNIIALKFSSPVGIRLHLWYVALILFMDHPLLGVGLNNFGKALKEFNQHNAVSDEALNYVHAHNEYLCALATGGIVGFVLTLLLFLVPIKLFLRDYQHNVWAKAGFWSVCLMSFFALTDCVFDRRMTVMAYIILVSVCMAGNMTLKNTKSTC